MTRSQASEGAPRYVTEYDAGDPGPEVRVCCPGCQRFLGTIRQRERGELLCPRCGVIYEARESAGVLRVSALRKTIITEESPEASLGQVLSRPELVREPTLKDRLMMLLWSLLMTGLLLAGLWVAVRYAAR